MPSRDSGRLVYRKLWKHDLPRFFAHLCRLDAADRRTRFTRELDHPAIRHYVDGLDWHRLILIGAFKDRMLRGVAALHLGGGPARQRAELAVSVERPLQQQGLASGLMERALVAARNRGVQRIWLVCLADNRGMRRVAGKFGAAIQLDRNEALGELRPLPANPATLIAEAIEDGGDYLERVAALGRRCQRQLAARCRIRHLPAAAPTTA